MQSASSHVPKLPANGTSGADKGCPISVVVEDVPLSLLGPEAGDRVIVRDRTRSMIGDEDFYDEQA